MLTRSSRETPIVFVAVGLDPVAARDVASLTRPGGGLTAATALQVPRHARPQITSDRRISSGARRAVPVQGTCCHAPVPPQLRAPQSSHARPASTSGSPGPHTTADPSVGTSDLKHILQATVERWHSHMNHRCRTPQPCKSDGPCTSWCWRLCWRGLKEMDRASATTSALRAILILVLPRS